MFVGKTILVLFPIAVQIKWCGGLSSGGSVLRLGSHREASAETQCRVASAENVAICLLDINTFFLLKRNPVYGNKKLLCITENASLIGTTALLFFTITLHLGWEKTYQNISLPYSYRWRELILFLCIFSPFCKSHSYVGFCLRPSSEARAAS